MVFAVDNGEGDEEDDGDEEEAALGCLVPVRVDMVPHSPLLIRRM